MTRLQMNSGCMKVTVRFIYNYEYHVMNTWKN